MGYVQIISVGLLVALGGGMFMVYRNTCFLAGVVRDSMDEATEHYAQVSNQVEISAVEEDEGTRPIGFHSPAKRGK